jgi:hypothetical protein
MKRIIDTFSAICNNRVYEYPIDREVPTPADVFEKVSYMDAIKAIELMACDEEFIRKHLRIGSTPPTKINIFKMSDEDKRLQTMIHDIFDVTYICK